MIRDRDEYGAVHVTDDMICVLSYSWQLFVRKGSLTFLSINDFKKMVKAVKSQLDPVEYYTYLEAWSAAIADRRYVIHKAVGDRALTKNERLILEHLKKFDSYIDKQISDLPEWAINEE
jgi:hypothetical protein